MCNHLVVFEQAAVDLQLGQRDKVVARSTPPPVRPSLDVSVSLCERCCGQQPSVLEQQQYVAKETRDFNLIEEPATRPTC